MTVEVKDDPEASHYEAFVDGELAGVSEYQDNGERVLFTHTETYPQFEGKGVGSALARFALTDAKGKGRRIVASCPFIKSYLEKHPELA